MYAYIRGLHRRLTCEACGWQGAFVAGGRRPLLRVAGGLCCRWQEAFAVVPSPQTSKQETFPKILQRAQSKGRCCSWSAFNLISHKWIMTASMRNSCLERAPANARHTSAYVSIRQHTSTHDLLSSEGIRERMTSSRPPLEPRR